MKKIMLAVMAFSVFSCSSPRPVVQNYGTTYQGPPALSTVQSVYSDADVKVCDQTFVDMEKEKQATLSCLNDSVKKLTDKTSIADEVITAAYYSCNREISSLSKVSYTATHCNMAKESGKSLYYIDTSLPYNDEKYEGGVRRAFYPKLVNDVLTRKKNIK